MQPDGWQYSAFCEQYRRWLGRQDVVLRQTHRIGEKLFVDHAGQTMPVTDRLTGQVRQAQIFVAVLGASNYAYAEATSTQSLEDWLSSHVRALAFLGSVPAAIVPDYPKSGVTKASRYEPELNPSYQDFAEHYGVAVLPARVRKPRDKAKVEGGVLIVERSILARLRNLTLFSLAELNQALASCSPSSTLAASHSRPALARAGLKRRSARLCVRCLRTRTSLRCGRRPTRAWTTTSKSRARTEQGIRTHRDTQNDGATAPDAQDLALDGGSHE